MLHGLQLWLFCIPNRLRQRKQSRREACRGCADFLLGAVEGPWWREEDWSGMQLAGEILPDITMQMGMGLLLLSSQAGWGTLVLCWKFEVTSLNVTRNFKGSELFLAAYLYPPFPFQFYA